MSPFLERLDPEGCPPLGRKSHPSYCIEREREQQIRGSIPACAIGFSSGSSHTSDLEIGIPVANLPCAWRYRGSAGTGWPGVSIP